MYIQMQVNICCIVWAELIEARLYSTFTRLKLTTSHRKHQMLLIADFGISRQHNTGATSAAAGGSSAGAGSIEGNGYGSAPWSAPETFHISNTKVWDVLKSVSGPLALPLVEISRLCFPASIHILFGRVTLLLPTCMPLEWLLGKSRPASFRSRYWLFLYQE